MSHPASTSPVYRLDHFVVPAAAMPAFTERLRHTQQALDDMPGCRQNLVLSRIGAGGEYDIATLVEWESAEALAAAKAAMQQRYAAAGFDPAGFMRALGIRADMASYVPTPFAAA
jgi:heme-degrading monooxygenase HmoA